jgi:hypothetical protein
VGVGISGRYFLLRRRGTSGAASGTMRGPCSRASSRR